MKLFKGIYPAVVTPFTRGGETIDAAALRGLIDYLIREGVHGLFPAGTTGEGISLTVAERKQMIDVVLDAADGRVPVIFHCSANHYKEIIEVCRHAQAAGAAGVAVLPPWYYACDAETILQHIQPVADAVPELPVFVYNIPSRTGNAMTLDILSELKQRCPNLAGIKESGCYENLEQWVTLQDERFTVFNGMDDKELAAYRLGVRAMVASFANLLPATFAAFHEAASREHWELAEACQARICELIPIIDSPVQIANIKAALRMKGLPSGAMRPPLRELRQEEEEFLQEELKKVLFL
ncbi:MAG: dihydrodipicolinate synthase family protein [bacterium]|jgi:4-hydroxy-tetrahydrodipicolinate synthase|nr:dihydrodipicolinate synthase family protein [bacterium]